MVHSHLRTSSNPGEKRTQKVMYTHFPIGTHPLIVHGCECECTMTTMRLRNKGGVPVSER